jgi:hypothetical protein
MKGCLPHLCMQRHCFDCLYRIVLQAKNALESLNERVAAWCPPRGRKEPASTVREFYASTILRQIRQLDKDASALLRAVAAAHSSDLITE